LGALAPVLISSVRSAAPGVRLRFLGELAADRPDSLREEVDLELGAMEPTQTDVTHEVVGADRIVVALRRGHPLASTRLTPKRLAGLAHLNVSRRGRLHDRVDEAFAALGLQRHVVASLPSAAAALEVVARSDFVTIVAGTLCSSLCRAFGVVTRPMPLDVPSTPVVVSWHRRFDSDVGHAWLRSQVIELLDTALEAKR
jgi:DNA-binding transcriptional LysR family regulator